LQSIDAIRAFFAALATVEAGQAAAVGYKLVQVALLRKSKECLRSMALPRGMCWLSYDLGWYWSERILYRNRLVDSLLR
jgi:hypothetical protein